MNSAVSLIHKSTLSFLNLIKSAALLLLLAIVIAACGGGGGGGNGSSDEDQTSGRTGTIEPEVTIRADFSGIDYPVNVYLPVDYGVDPDARYPVLYMLDSEFWFSTTVDIVDSRNKSVIVVAIGNTGGSGLGRRAIDYRMPGARDYYNFLITQVIPFIDASYLTDVSERTLSGHSFGGLFTGLAVLLEEPNNRYFSRYFSQDGSFWYQPGVTADLNNQLLAIDNNLPIQLILAGATGASGNLVPVRRHSRLLEGSGYIGLDLMVWPYDASHDGQYSLSMVDFVELTYSDVE